MESYIYNYPKTRTNYSCAVLFPNRYSLAMSNLGFHTLYHSLQVHQEILCERFFYNGKTPESYENNRPLHAFDVVMISISFEMDVINIVDMLRRSDLLERIEDDPIIMIGGIGASLLSGTLKHFSDILVTTRAEWFIKQFHETIQKTRKKSEVIHQLNLLDGIYDSSTITQKKLNWTNTPLMLDKPAHSVIISDEAEFANRALIEISQSCRYQCSFCLVSNFYGNYESFDSQIIIETAKLYSGITNKIGLVAATLTNHPEFSEIIESLNQLDFQLSFSAFRIEALSDDLLKTVIENENRTLVVAPETASQKMKSVINKTISNDLIINKIKIACEIGIKRLKLYFLIGLPDETMEDIQENIQLISEIRKVSHEYGKKHGYIPEIIVDINPLVPKPWTILANAPFEPTKTLKKKILAIKKGVRNLGRVFVYGESPRNAKQQYELSHQLLSPDDIIQLTIQRAEIQ
jgi:radical SAM superfamily enzyme YgiQ (UPF0313 family)